MQVQTISTKELREDFSKLLLAVEEGRTLNLTYRSKKIARIKSLKVPKKQMSKEEAVKLVRKLAGGNYKFTKHYSPDELNRMYDEEIYKMPHEK
jgi:antitoxin (DNA-binding transcriptional repressor) of toxin-antitoxin stability system